ncbi:unnamed protein product [Heterobilharzia americana]|nr:unnamed protein product [Heterobilharzia americana]
MWNLLGILPSLLSQYPHLKVLLIINTRLSTYKSWYNKNIRLEHSQAATPHNYETSSLAVSTWDSVFSDMNHAELPNDTKREICISGDTNPLVVSALEKTDIPKLDEVKRDVILDVSQSSSNFLLSSNTHVKSPFIETRNDISVKKTAYQPLQGFSNYFNGAPIINIPHIVQQSNTFYLEDILEWTSYSIFQMDEALTNLIQDSIRCQNMYIWLTNKESVNCISNDYKVNKMKENYGNDVIKHGLFETTHHSGMLKKPLILSRDLVKFCLESDQILNEVEDYGDNCLADHPKQHANDLLWTIWHNSVPDVGGTELTNHQNKEVGETVVNARVHACLTNLLQCILAGWISVDYEHSNTGLTPLMVCSAAGLLEAVERLLVLGANPFTRIAMPYDLLISQAHKQYAEDFRLFGPKHRRITIKNEIYNIVGVNAYDLARIFGYNKVANLLKIHMVSQSLRHVPENWEAILLRFGSWFQNPSGSSKFDKCILNESQTVQTIPQTSNEDRIYINPHNLHNKLLLSYQIARNRSEPETVVDYDLLTTLIVKIDSSLPEGAVLVFLPSYEEIITLRERLLSPDTSPWKSSRKPLLLVLHSRMLVADLKTIYDKSQCSVRKLILSSNISESCMTFDDVTYVIDCGLDCTEQYLDWAGTTSLRNHWITKSNAIQRQTRIGRNMKGICFHMYSRLRFIVLPEERESIVRGHAVEEACIQARLLAPPNISIDNVLRSLPKPPLPESSRSAIQALMEMDILDNFEELTELGYHICDMPIPPHYAKMVLVSVVLKCLDPILTISCILAYTEPFTTPRNATERRELMNARRKFSSDSYSDHMVLLRAFQFWQKARSEAFEVITVIRTQLLGQLRASGFVKARGSGDIRDLNSNSENWAVVKAAIVAGMYGNLARLDRRNSCFRVANRNHSQVMLHPNSVIATNSDGTKMNLNNLPCDWLVFDDLLTLGDSKEVNKTTCGTSEIHELNDRNYFGSPYSNSQLNNPQSTSTTFKSNTNDAITKDLKIIRCASIVSPITVALMAGPMRLCPEMIKQSHANVNAFNFTMSSEESQQQRQDDQAIYNNRENKFEHNNNDIHEKNYAEFENDSESNSDSETDIIMKSLLQNNSQLPSIHTDIRETLGLIIQQKTKTEQNPINIKLKPDISLNSTLNSSEFKDSVMNLSTNFISMQISDYKDYAKSPFQRQTYSQMPVTSSLSSTKNTQTNNTTFCLDSTGFLQFILDADESQMVIGLRQKWHALFLRRLKNPGKLFSQQDEAVLNCLTSVLMAEEQALGLRQPAGVGARPRPMATELCNQFDYPQADSFQLTRMSSEKPINNNSISDCCITTESNTPILSINSANGDHLEQDNATGRYSSLTNTNCTSHISNLNLLGHFNKLNEQHSFQAYRNEMHIGKSNPTAKYTETAGTERWALFPKVITNNHDRQACADNPHYISPSTLTKMNITLPKNDTISPIINLNKEFSKPLVYPERGNQNFCLDSLVSWNRVNLFDNNKKQQNNQEEIHSSQTNQCLTTWGNTCFSNNPCAFSSVMNNYTISNPTTSVTNNYAITNDISLFDLNNREKTPQELNLWCKHYDKNFRL